MLDPYRVRLMTKAETIRREDRELSRLTSLNRTGYTARGMLKSFLGVTIAFGLVLALYVTHARPAEEVAGGIPAEGVITCVVIYVAAVLIWLIVSFFVYRWRFDRKTARLAEYHDCLRRLKRLR